MMEKSFLSFRQIKCDSWEDIRTWVNCDKCSLRRKGEKVVLGAGNKHADIMIVSEYPGREETRAGIPFKGVAGEYLKELIRMLYKQDLFDVFYVTNVVACRPPKNKRVSVNTLNQCIKRLLCEIYLVDPMVIIAAGSLAIQTLTHKSYPPEAMAGTIEVIELPGKVHPYKKPVMIWPNPIQFWRHSDMSNDGMVHQAFYALYKLANFVAKTKNLIYHEDVKPLDVHLDEPETWRIYAKGSQSDDSESR